MAKYKLGEICEFYSGTGFPVTYQGKAIGDFPFYKVGDIANNVVAGNVYLSLCNNYISNQDALEIKGTIIPKDTVVFAKIGEALKLNRRALTSCNCLIDNNAMGIAPKRKFLQTGYFFYFMKNLKLQNFAESTTVPSVRKSKLEQIEIETPPLNTQNEVERTLDKISSLITIRQHQLQKLDELIKARFVELFGDPISNPMNWNKRTLKEVCIKLNDGTHFSPESFSMGDYKYITAKNIKASGFDFSNITYVPEAVHRPIFERCNPEQGDVLYIKDGATTGIAIVNTLKEEFTLLSSVALLKQNRNVINGYFLAALLNNADMYSDIRNNMGGAAITRLTIAKLNAVKVIVPPLDLQNRFAAFVHQVDKSKAVEGLYSSLCL